jgi:Na+-transporting NADH:ubiquinone oxidoreductase subunit NqrF
MTTKLPIKLEHLPGSLPLDNAIRIELAEGIPIFRASSFVQQRIETLLNKQKDVSLTDEEEKEFDKYEELDDYLSLVNRLIRALAFIS